MITNRESNQVLTHILKASLGLEGEEQALRGPQVEQWRSGPSNLADNEVAFDQNSRGGIDEKWTF